MSIMPPTKSQEPTLAQIKSRIFLSVAGIVLLFNFSCLIKETIKTQQLRHRHPYIFLGDRFRGLEMITQNTPYIGYYTDKNLDNNRAARQFAQAQLVLAPSILDLNNTDHEYIIFDCSSPVVALAKIQEIGARPLRGNAYGIILARRPNSNTLQTGAAIKPFDKTKQKPRL